MGPAAEPVPARALLVMVLLIAGLYGYLLWPGADRTLTPELGLDLRGGTSITLVPEAATSGEGVTGAQIDQAVAIIRDRLEGHGAAEAEVTAQGSGSGRAIVVAVPGQNQQRIVELAGATAELEFRTVRAVAAGSSASAGPTLSDDLDTAFAELDCATPGSRRSALAAAADRPLVTCARDGSLKYVLNPSRVAGSDVVAATARVRTVGLPEWMVVLEFDPQGAADFAEVTGELARETAPNNQFAIVLDGQVVSAVEVTRGAVTGGAAEITGNFTEDSATDLANLLDYGALPLRFGQAQVDTISPTLGDDQLRAGLLAGAIGLVLVVAYLLVAYRRLGAVAVASLAVAAALVYALLVVLGEAGAFTLTLAGVTGLIVAIGITADSFVVLFERVRDEVREGRDVRTAVETGWGRARRTILAADLVVLLAAVVLYLIAVGGVRGFAFALGLATLVDLVVVFAFTKPVLTVLARGAVLEQAGIIAPPTPSLPQEASR